MVPSESLEMRPLICFSWGPSLRRLCAISEAKSRGHDGGVIGGATARSGFCRLGLALHGPVNVMGQGTLVPD